MNFEETQGNGSLKINICKPRLILNYLFIKKMNMYAPLHMKQCKSVLHFLSDFILYSRKCCVQLLAQEVLCAATDGDT